MLSGMLVIFFRNIKHFLIILDIFAQNTTIMMTKLEKMNDDKLYQMDSKTCVVKHTVFPVLLLLCISNM